MGLNEPWKNTVNDGLTNRDWDEYDELIQRETTAYNHALRSTAGFRSLDWKMFKAVLWVESGGPRYLPNRKEIDPNCAWMKRAMQIGNPGDPGFQSLKDGEGAAGIIMAKTLKIDIRTKSIDDPFFNIRAGIAYILVRLANSQEMSANDTSDAQTYNYMVLPGDCYDKIVKKLRGKGIQTTVESMKELNRKDPRLIRQGDVILYRKAGYKRVITGWKPFTTGSIAIAYNVGDANYKEKLDYILDLFKRICSPTEDAKQSAQRGSSCDEQASSVLKSSTAVGK